MNRRLIFSCFAIALLVACGKKNTPFPGRQYTGTILGKSYSIDVVGDSTDLSKDIDSVNKLFASQFNLFSNESVIGKLNSFKNSDRAFVFKDSSLLFGIVFDLAKEANQKSKLSFDPTLNPIRREWYSRVFSGVGGEPNLDSLFQFVGFKENFDLNEISDDSGKYIQSNIRKKDPRSELDLTSIAVAYWADVISDLLSIKGASQYRINVEYITVCHGAIIDSLNIVPMNITGDTSDKSIRLINGAFSLKTAKEKRSMIDPSYGYPVDNEMIYVAVSSNRAVDAEVFSEAFMIMGIDQAFKWYEENEDSNIQSWVFYKRENEITSASTEGFDRMIINESYQEEP